MLRFYHAIKPDLVILEITTLDIGPKRPVVARSCRFGELTSSRAAKPKQSGRLADLRLSVRAAKFILGEATGELGRALRQSYETVVSGFAGSLVAVGGMA